MFIGLLLPLLAIGCGLSLHRWAGLPLGLASGFGLATIVVIGVWCEAIGAPALVSTALVVGLAFLGAAAFFSTPPGSWATLRAGRGPLLVVTLAAALPVILLGSAFAGLDTPVSTHDGAFHVETIESLRQGVPVQMWYPIGFHALAATILDLVPWLDTARGTTEVGVGVAALAPLGLVGLGLGLGLHPLHAGAGGLVLALTYIYPYDNNVWGGWPLSTSTVLLLGLWTVALYWTARPGAMLAIVAGVLTGALVLTHGTELYSAALGLAVIAAVRWHQIRLARLAVHVPLALACALVCAAPYLGAVVAWTSGGGASSVGLAALEDTAAHPELGAGGDWLEFVLGVTGAASFIDLPVRAVLLCLGTRGRHMGVVVGGWVLFGGMLFGVSFLDLAPIRWLYAVTFPWLVQHRPPQMVVLFASLLIANGAATLVTLIRALRPRLTRRPHAWRRVAVVSGLLLGFFAEGSAISIYKTLDQVIGAQNAFSPDDRAAMAWLRQHARPGEVVVNDQAADAGIWAPYKAGLPILLPRSASGPVVEARRAVLTHVLDLGGAPGAEAEACALHVGYLYAGVAPFPLDKPLLPNRAALDGAAGLEEVFSSGDTAVFRIHLNCA